MEPIGKGMLIIQKFLLCISLRAGTTFISWWTCIYSFCLSTILLMLHFQHGSPILVLIIGILWSGIFLSGRALYNFPVPNKEYSATSIHAKSLLYLAWYNGALATIILIVFVVFCSYAASDKHPEDKLGFGFILVILSTGLHIHFVSVIYSYYVSVLKIDENIDNLVSNHFNRTANNEGAPNVPFDVRTEPIYSECSLVNNQHYDLLSVTPSTSTKVTEKNDFQLA